MGAIINMAPELYNGIIAAVPFVDVVTTMLDESIPLTTGEYDEGGNPNNKESLLWNPNINGFWHLAAGHLFPVLSGLRGPPSRPQEH